jgi:NAD(P)-dependent dehydrogenase (short-subunit alcohol dehydrogenase family)
MTFYQPTAADSDLLIPWIRMNRQFSKSSAGRYREKRSPRRSVRYKVGDDLVMEAGSEVADPHGRDFVFLNIYFARLGQTSDAAGVAAFLASADAEKIAGATIVVDDGLELYRASERRICKSALLD